MRVRSCRGVDSSDRNWKLIVAAAIANSKFFLCQRRTRFRCEL